MNFEFMSVDIDKRQFTINNCDVISSLFVIFKNERVNKIIKYIVLTTISFHIIITISIKFQDKFVLIDKNYNFYLLSKIRFDFDEKFYVYIINVNILIVQV